MRIAHEKAHELDRAGVGPGEEIDLTAQLRPVTMEDFWEARKKVRSCIVSYEFFSSYLEFVRVPSAHLQPSERR